MKNVELKKKKKKHTAYRGEIATVTSLSEECNIAGRSVITATFFTSKVQGKGGTEEVIAYRDLFPAAYFK